MTLYTIQIRISGSRTSPPELVCTYESLAEITHILDRAEPYRVFEYRISSSGGGTYSTKSFPFLCEKLVTEFDWSKQYVPPEGDVK
jgi:hypothetical protein